MIVRARAQGCRSARMASRSAVRCAACHRKSSARASASSIALALCGLLALSTCTLQSRRCSSRRHHSCCRSCRLGVPPRRGQSAPRVFELVRPPHTRSRKLRPPLGCAQGARRQPTACADTTYCERVLSSVRRAASTVQHRGVVDLTTPPRGRATSLHRGPTHCVRGDGICPTQAG